MSDIDPSILSMYDEEAQFLSEETSRNSLYNNRVKIPKGNCWTTRFLPVEMGPKKTWFARAAFHWVGGIPTICLAHTSPDFGGDPNYPCKMCNTIEELETYDEFKKHAWRERQTPQWLTYCLVFEKGTEDQMKPIEPPELWVPYEFWLFKSGFETLFNDWRRGIEPGRGHIDSPYSVLDFYLGSDYRAVSREKKGIQLHKQNPYPIADQADMDAVVQTVWNNLKIREIDLPTEDDVEKASEKIIEAVRARAGTRGSRRTARAQYPEDEAPTRTAPPASPAVSAPRTSPPVHPQAAAPQPAAPQAPARRSVSPPPARPAASTPARPAATAPSPSRPTAVPPSTRPPENVDDADDLPEEVNEHVQPEEMPEDTPPPAITPPPAATQARPTKLTDSLRQRISNLEGK